MTKFVSKETITRLLKDVKDIIKNPLIESNIYYVHDDEDMMRGYAMIIGQSDTPYSGGYYLFELNYPLDYPHSPPKVKYCTNGNSVRFNPNLYTCGKVCVSLLNTWSGDQWTSCQNISTVLLTLCTLLCKNPLLNEPGVSIKNTDIEPYNEIIQYANINIAICDIVNKKEGLFLPFFNLFWPYIKEHFLRNYDKLLEFVENKNNEFNKEARTFKTSNYNMKMDIDYNKLILKLNKSKKNIE